jgi:hypothetical protein
MYSGKIAVPPGGGGGFSKIYKLAIKPVATYAETKRTSEYSKELQNINEPRNKKPDRGRREV